MTMADKHTIREDGDHNDENEEFGLLFVNERDPMIGTLLAGVGVCVTVIVLTYFLLKTPVYCVIRPFIRKLCNSFCPLFFQLCWKPGNLH